MKSICLTMILCIALVTGCTTGRATVVTAPPVVDTCRMPSGYRVNSAIETAKNTLNDCPEKFDEVFTALLDVARHNPTPGNAELIQDMFKDLIRQNKVSETYSKSLYQQYFSRRFVSIPDVKVYRLSGETDSIKKELKRELELKRIGMVECCNDKESYTLAEAEFARLLNFIENLLLNEDYLQTVQR